MVLLETATPVALPTDVGALVTAVVAIANVVIASRACTFGMPEGNVSAAVGFLLFIKTASPMTFHVPCIPTVEAVGQFLAAITVAVVSSASSPWIACLVPLTMVRLRGCVEFLNGS